MRVYSEQTFYGQEGGGFFICGRPHFLAQKILDFLKFMVCPHGQGGRGELSRADIFRTRGEGVNFFAILYGRLLWMPLTLNLTISMVYMSKARVSCVGGLKFKS